MSPVTTPNLTFGFGSVLVKTFPSRDMVLSGPPHIQFPTDPDPKILHRFTVTLG